MTRPSPAERFWSKVEMAGADECWLWSGPKVGAGYGYFHVGMSPEGVAIRQYAHRWSYEQAKGPIPDGLTIDHLCRNRLCVNPAHLEAVTLQENHVRRRGFKTGPYNVGDYCRHGHERTPENTRLSSHGARVCITCQRDAGRDYDANRRSRNRTKSPISQ